MALIIAAVIVGLLTYYFLSQDEMSTFQRDVSFKLHFFVCWLYDCAVRKFGSKIEVIEMAGTGDGYVLLALCSRLQLIVGRSLAL